MRFASCPEQDKYCGISYMAMLQRLQSGKYTQAPHSKKNPLIPTSKKKNSMSGMEGETIDQASLIQLKFKTYKNIPMCSCPPYKAACVYIFTSLDPESPA